MSDFNIGVSNKRQRADTDAGTSRGLRFDECTIYIRLARRAQLQGDIFAKNFKRRGATVVENVGDLRLSQGTLIMVADPNTFEEANKAVQEMKSIGKEMHVVSKGWAISSLREMKPLPCAQFVLATTNAALVPSKDSFPEDPQSYASAKTSMALLQSPSHVQNVSYEFRPVWDSYDEFQITLELKQRIASRVPKWMVMRFTYNSSLVDLPNGELAENLRKIARKRKLLTPNLLDGDIRSLVYKRAAAAVSILPFKISSQQDVGNLRGLSSSILAAVDQFCTRGCLAEAVDFSTNQQLRTLHELTNVFGISIATARHLYSAGVRSVDDALRKQEQGTVSLAADTLQALQLHSELREPVTVQDGIELFKRIKLIASHELECKLHFKLCGGFRRGEPTGHDLDILYTHADETRTDSVSKQLLEALDSQGLLLSRLRVQHDTLGYKEQRYFQHTKSPPVHYEYAHDTMLTICKTCNGQAIRVDFVGVRQAAEMPFATLAWSGSILFQRELRQYATDCRGWIFSAHGLFDCATFRRVPFEPACKTEHDVFKVLGLKYIAPFERCC